MKIAISYDEYFPLIDALIEDVKKRGHEVVCFGPGDWPVVTMQAVEEVQSGKADEAIVLCWTGTGCTLIANKASGIRAALCVDAETAKGARIWNHANVLGISFRLTTQALLKEILASWFETPYSTDEWNRLQMQRIKDVECTSIKNG